jgi:hypothetical protein
LWRNSSHLGNKKNGINNKIKYFLLCVVCFAWCTHWKNNMRKVQFSQLFIAFRKSPSRLLSCLQTKNKTKEWYERQKRYLIFTHTQKLLGKEKVFPPLNI